MTQDILPLLPDASSGRVTKSWHLDVAICDPFWLRALLRRTGRGRGAAARLCQGCWPLGHAFMQEFGKIQPWPEISCLSTVFHLKWCPVKNVPSSLS